MKRSCVPRGSTSDRCFQLVRSWGPYRPGRWVHMIHLRPGLANGLAEDAQSFRTIEIAKNLGYTGVVTSYLFPYRVRKWPEIVTMDDPSGGAENNLWIDSSEELCRDTIACWGDKGTFRDRDIEVWSRHRPMRCLGFTLAGNPQILKNVDEASLLLRNFWIDPRQRNLKGSVEFYDV